jgi:choline dehydrogenase-like flavoprotein
VEGFAVLIDARELPHGTVLEADVCVVGGGPAGLVTADRLAEQGLQVVLLESGGRDLEPEPQALSAGEPGPIRDYTAHELRERRRQVGGLGAEWQATGGPATGTRLARMVTPGPLDFAPLPWLPRSGWPVGRDELLPWYRLAHEQFALGPHGLPTEAWGRDASRPLELPGGDVDTTVSPYISGMTFFGMLADRLAAAPNARLVVHATALGVELQAAGQRAASVRAAVLASGARFEVRPGRVVLAAGGIENARLLLLSGADGGTVPGNAGDMVGRCFMEHPYVAFGVLALGDGAAVERLGLYDLHRVDDVTIIASLLLADQARRREELLGAAAYLVPRHASFTSPAVRSLFTIAPSLRARRPRRDLPRHLATILRGAPAAARFTYLRMRQPVYQHVEHLGGWSAYPPDPTRYGALHLIGLVEQAPDPRNRVSLGSGVDPLGSPVARLDVHWSAIDRRSARRAAELFGGALEDAGLGSFTAWDPLGGSGEPVFSPCHHMGTTRMADDPADGVVDRDLKVHGTDNLYVAGSSVFPTGIGYSNPTLTILALALRLADHLGGRPEA